ncbi:hypothetical protein AMS68_005483 [Peltaster fructicola]|uniref:Oxidoreductase n=1 Tax=Peltaster fructicola TaxID=286661 RepID=A0A6H0XZ61_9PEZI|nr:hypothetical protein AMS68_005483 [Peltaster fructicola]
MFGFGKKFDPVKDIPSLDGKVILVTGGNTGLGQESVLQLAKHNPREIFLAARTPSKAEEAITEIKKAVPDGKITFLQMDLTSFESIKKAADEFKSKSDRLDILLNNAGIMATPWDLTKEGYEIQFGTNHMGHALLTKLLLPTLLKTAELPGSDVRVVDVSSDGHNLAPSVGIVWDQPELEKSATWTRYGQSKLANILHARAIAKRYPSITATAIHPGVIITNLYASVHKWNFIVKVGTSIGALFLPDVQQGTKNQLWAATAPKEEVKTSHYWRPVGSKSSGSSHAQNMELSDKLWDWTEAELKKHGYSEKTAAA